MNINTVQRFLLIVLFTGILIGFFFLNENDDTSNLYALTKWFIVGMIIFQVLSLFYLWIKSSVSALMVIINYVFMVFVIYRLGQISLVVTDDQTQLNLARTMSGIAMVYTLLESGYIWLHLQLPKKR